MKCESMVYLNQIFTNLETSSCPLPGELTADNTTFTQQLTFFDPVDGNCHIGCGCCDGSIDFADDLTFTIENTQVFVTSFTLPEPESFPAESVTLNGIPIDTLSVAGDRFTAATDTLMPQIENCICLENGQSTKAMLLIQGAGPWLAKLTIVVYGSVFGCGTCKKFRLVLTTREGVSIDIPGSSTFGVSQLCLPCTKGGRAPVIQFSFLASATLLNPVIVPDPNGDTCSLTLTGVLVAEPAATIQVTRETLFTIDADAVPQPCDDLARCVQAPGTCACTADFPPLPNPCCDDGCSGNGTAATDTTGIGCGCGCGCSTVGYNGCRHNETDKIDTGCHQNQVCCQFNGINGCSL